MTVEGKLNRQNNMAFEIVPIQAYQLPILNFRDPDICLLYRASS